MNRCTSPAPSSSLPGSRAMHEGHSSGRRRDLQDRRRMTHFSRLALGHADGDTTAQTTGVAAAIHRPRTASRCCGGVGSAGCRCAARPAAPARSPCRSRRPPRRRGRRCVGELLGQQPPGQLATLLDQHVLAELGQPAGRLCFREAGDRVGSQVRRDPPRRQRQGRSVPIRRGMVDCPVVDRISSSLSRNAAGPPGSSALPDLGQTTRAGKGQPDRPEWVQWVPCGSHGRACRP